MRVGVLAGVCGAVAAGAVALGPTGVVSAAPPACVVSGPADGSAALLRDAVLPRYAYVGYEVAQHGLWAGVAYDGSDRYRLLVQRPGHAVRVLMPRTRLPGAAAVGVRRGKVVANVARANNEPHRLHFDAYVIGARHRVKLASRPRWPITMASAVTDSGSIIGYWRSNTHPLVRHVITWATPRSKPRVVPMLGKLRSEPVVDQAGDIAWENRSGFAMVRLADGTIHLLDHPHPAYLEHGFAAPAQAAGRVIVGIGAQGGVVRWNLNAPPGSGPIEGRDITAHEYRNGVPDAVGSTGAFVDGLRARGRRYYAPDGQGFAMPPQDVSYPDVAINSSNVVAYTARSDHLVHFLSCP